MRSDGAASCLDALDYYDLLSSAFDSLIDSTSTTLVFAPIFIPCDIVAPLIGLVD